MSLQSEWIKLCHSVWCLVAQFVGPNTPGAYIILAESQESGIPVERFPRFYPGITDF